MTKSRGVNRPRFKWNVDTDALLRELYPDFPTELLAQQFGCTLSATYQRAQKLGLKKSEAYMASPHAQRLRRGDEVGKAYRFKPGQVPANKGLRRPGWAPGRMAATQFKKGRPATEARNYVPIGTEKYDVKRKVIVRKVTDDPAIFPAQRWRPVHVLIWQAEHGQVPPRHIVIFKRGQKTLVSSEITASRLELVTLAENMRRNSYHNNYPKEVAQLIQLKGALSRKINRRLRDDKE